MEPTLHTQHHRRLLTDLVRDGLNRSLSGSDSLLRPTTGDLCDGPALLCFVEVDLGTGVVFDLVDGGSALAEDAGDGAVRDGELEDVVGFFLEFNGLGRERRSESSFLSKCMVMRWVICLHP